MNTESKKLDGCRRQLDVKLDAGEVKAVVKEVEKAFVREVRMPGFRPGKVPVEMIRRNYAEGLKQETKRLMIRKYVDDAAKAEGLEVVSFVEFKDAAAGEDGGSFTAVVDVKPQVKLPQYKGLKVTLNDVTVKDEDVNAQVERFREAYAKFEDAKEGEAVADGDFVQFDYAGTVGGKPILEVAPEAKVVASGTGFWTQVEEGRFLPEILDALKGMKAGETKEGIEAKFDGDAAPEGLKGETAVYTVTLKAFRRRILPTDAELAEKTKSESVEKLAGTIRGQMQKRADEEEAVRRENEAVDLVMDKCTFDVPESQVQRATDAYIEQFSRRAQQSGLDASYFEKQRDKIYADARTAAEKQVRMWYVFEAIAKEEKIEAKDDELGKKVADFILANAK